MKFMVVGGIPSEERFGSPVVVQLSPANASLSASLDLKVGRGVEALVDQGMVTSRALVRGEIGVSDEVTVRETATVTQYVEADPQMVWMAETGVVGMAAGLGFAFGTPWGFGMQLWLAIVAGLDAYWQIERHKRS